MFCSVFHVEFAKSFIKLKLDKGEVEKKLDAKFNTLTGEAREMMYCYLEPEWDS